MTVDGLGVITGDQDLRPAVLFFAVVGSGTLAAASSLRRQWQATRALEAHVDARGVTTTADVDTAARRATLHRAVEVVADDEPFCFTYGLVTPRVAVSTGFIGRVTTDELGAVLAHERYHVRNRDPLKLVVARALTRAFFFLPVLRLLHQRYLAGRELAADRRAVRHSGRRPLAGALVKAVAGPDWSEVGAAAAITGDQYLELRIDQLERGAEPPLEPLPRVALWVSLLGVGLLVAALVGAVAAAGGPAELMGPTGDADSWSVPAPLAAAGMVLCIAGWTLAGWFALRYGRGRQRAGRGSDAKVAS
ncbi:MAG: M56 family metallopeptidase [Acidimicrobiales bacterium]